MEHVRLSWMDGKVADLTMEGWEASDDLLALILNTMYDPGLYARPGAANVLLACAADVVADTGARYLYVPSGLETEGILDAEPPQSLTGMTAGELMPDGT